MASPRRPSLRAHLNPHHKLWLDWDGAFLMGPRYLHFLDAVDRVGTIRAAGREVGWSYRTCLNRIREMERVLGAATGGSDAGAILHHPEAHRLRAGPLPVDRRLRPLLSAARPLRRAR